MALFLISAVSVSAENMTKNVSPTPWWWDVYSMNTSYFGGRPVSAGSIVRAYAKNSGVLCGEFKITSSGTYGVMHIYGDDFNTSQIEGAKAGEKVFFTINSLPAYLKNSSLLPVWKDRGLSQVDLVTFQPKLPVNYLNSLR